MHIIHLSVELRPRLNTSLCVCTKVSIDVVIFFFVFCLEVTVLISLDNINNNLLLDPRQYVDVEHDSTIAIKIMSSGQLRCWSANS